MWKQIIGAAILAHASTGAGAASASADTYPSKSIRLIVGFTPGGSDDYVGRVVGARITQTTGQAVIVDNRPGAGGNVGAEITARANPDGYTLSSVGSITLASSPSLYVKLGYDPRKDFSYISRVAIGANVLVAHPALAAKSVSELVALARAQPSAVRYATPGVASLGHLTMELLQSLTGIKIVHVPYKGPAPAIAAVVGGEVQIGIGASTAALPIVQAKRLNALAVTSLKRLGPLPDVPTVAESGFPGFNVVNNHGILAPAGTPMSVVRLLNAEVQKMLQMDDIKAKFPALGLEAAGSTPDEFRDIVIAELTRWTRVIKDANITAN
jgi:tripartite-type tricarboxylate transporter receptor subunit TctC